MHFCTNSCDQFEINANSGLIWYPADIRCLAPGLVPSQNPGSAPDMKRTPPVRTVQALHSVISLASATTGVDLALFVGVTGVSPHSIVRKFAYSGGCSNFRRARAGYLSHPASLSLSWTTQDPCPYPFCQGGGGQPSLCCQKVRTFRGFLQLEPSGS